MDQENMACRTKAKGRLDLRQWAPLGLVIVLIVAGYLRFTNLDWDEGKWIHPDEAHMQTTLTKIHSPDRLSVYFDTHRSPLNVRNSGDRYSYGTLPLFLVRFASEWLDRACGESPDGLHLAIVSLLMGEPDLACTPGTFTGFGSKRVGRLVAGMADMGTVMLLYLIGRRLYDEATGLLAAVLGTFTAFLIQQAHFFTVDSMMAFFMLLTAYFAVRAGQTGSWGSFALAGLATGLAMACKLSAVPAALFVVLAAAAWLWSLPSSRRKAELGGSLARLVLAGLLAVIAFRVAQPYAFEGPGFFGVRLSPEWLARLEQIRHEQSGDVNSYPDQQWTGRTAILFPWVNIVVWGMGIPLGLAAWAGWAVMGWELWRGKRVHLILWVWAAVFFFYQGTRWVKSMRYFVALYPVLIVMAAYLLVRACRMPARRWRALGITLTVAVTLGAILWAGAVFSIYLRPHTRLAASRWIYANVPEGSSLATEHWDWGPPLPLDGYNPGTMYDGFEMENYHEDTWEKQQRLFEWLDRADYIILGSNRLYASIPRLAARYPLTTEYYRALLGGELGFELVADFTSRPALFGLVQFPDQETPFPLMAVAADGYLYQNEPIRAALPPAEEAFSVYDHPRVLVFGKTDEYSRQRVEAVLGGINVSRALNNLRPVEMTAAPNLLDFDPETWADQQAGGTWSEMFNRQSLLNRYPGLGAVAWWAVVTLLGWMTFPLLFVTLPRLHDRGYGLARMLGMLAVAYMVWLAASLKALPHTRGSIVRMVLLLAVLGGGVGWFRRRDIHRFVRDRWRVLLITEGLFVLLYAAWIVVRLLQPDLWHPIVGGEKPMDLAYFNAVLKSTWFPPYNPWFAGGYVNYYYFGFVIVGAVTKLVGTVPAIAYNLAVPLLFALTGVGAFSVAYNLFGQHGRSAILAGVMAVLLTVVLGNLGVVRLVRAALIKLGGGPDPFPSVIPEFPQTVAMLRGLWDVVAHGTALPLRTESWYWDPTRIIPAETGNPIAEFPAFTFLYGDLHAHMIAFPLTLLALCLVVNWARTSRPRWGSLLIGGLVLGALRPTNTWDYPTYLILGLVALVVGAWQGWRADLHRRRPGEQGEWWRITWRHARPLILRGGLLVVLPAILFLPYTRHYAGYQSLERWYGLHTPLGIYVWIYGIFLFPVLTRLLVEVTRALEWRRDRLCGLVSRSKRYVWGAWGVLLAVAALLVVVLGCVLALLAGTATDMAPTLATVWRSFALVPVSLITLPVFVLTALLVFMPGMPARRRLLWLLVGLAMAISAGVEVIIVKGDIGRQNTVFKFYLQVWILLAVVGGVCVAWVREHARHWRWGHVWWIAMMLLLLGGGLFLPFGIRARAIDRMASETGLTLDGMAFMEHSVVYDGAQERDATEVPLVGDYYAIRYLQDKVQGSPVILEAVGWREYLWGSRVSIYTGLPTVVGWRWHQIQQRPVLPGTMVDWRLSDVNLCYNTASVTQAQDILARYDVRLIYVGDYERAYYDPAGLAKFDDMVALDLLRTVHDAHGVKIYEVVASREMGEGIPARVVPVQ